MFDLLSVPASSISFLDFATCRPSVITRSEINKTLPATSLCSSPQPISAPERTTPTRPKDI